MGGWNKKDFVQASYKGIAFDLLTIGDGFKKDLAKHRVPFAHGGPVEDLGLAHPTKTCTAVFMNEKYPNWKKFTDALKEYGPGELIHPLDGIFQVIAESVDVTRDDRAYYAEARVVFVVVDGKDEFIAAPLPSAEALETAVNNAGKDAMTETGPALGDRLAPLIAGTHNVMAQLNAVTGAANGYLNQATQPFRLATSFITFATDLPGSILSSFAGAIETVAGSYQAAINAPAAFTQSLISGIADIKSALGGFNPPAKPGENSPASAAKRDAAALALAAGYGVVSASIAARAAAMELSIDEDLEQGRNTDLATRGAPAASGQAGSTARSRQMTMDEIDAAVAAARQSITAAIAAAEAGFGPRAWPVIAGLHKQAALLQESADAARLRRERLIKYEAVSPTSIWLLAFNLDGSIDNIGRLMRVNGIPDPNFIPAGTELSVYAG